MPDFIILIDGLRHDYIDQQRSPFLHRMKESGLRAEVIETYSFQTRPAYFAGLEPDQSDICHLFQYDPESSPFWFLKTGSPLKKSLKLHTYCGLSERWPRKIIHALGKASEYLKGHPASARVLSSHTIPIDLLQYFSPSERDFTDSPSVFRDSPTIFDLMRKKGKTWSWIGYPTHFGSTNNILEHYLISSKADVCYLHFSELDWVGHKFGPVSAEMDQAISSLDSTIKGLLTPYLENGARAVIFGDHGMVEVTNSVNLASHIEKYGIRVGTDLIYFLDSTQARFWVLNPQIKQGLLECLAKLECGRILSEEDKLKLHINFSHNRYGEIVFALNGGWIIHPSFFSSAGLPPKGMHGYTPEVLDNMTQFMAFGNAIGPRNLDTIEMVGIFPLIVETIVERA